MDGETYEIDKVPALVRRQNHDVAVVVDRLVVKSADRNRLVDSLETALRAADGDGRSHEATVQGPKGAQSQIFSEKFGCPTCGLSLPELEPRQFSFNSPFGACVECHGVGTTREVNSDLILGDGQISILEGVVLPWGEPSGYLRKVVLPTLAKAFKFDLAAPWSAHSEAARHALIYGMPGKVLKYVAEGGKRTEYEAEWEGVLKNVERRYKETSSDSIRSELEAFMVEIPLPGLPGTAAQGGVPRRHGRGEGARRRGRHAGRDRPRLLRAGPRPRQWPPGTRRRCGGTDPQGSDRPAPLPAGRRPGVSHDGPRRRDPLRGEAQRIRLATQIGSRLVGVLYILDEPSIGLHQRDNERLLGTLRGLRDLGNTVIVVEHDEETIRAADHIIDLGPGAGKLGGHVVVEGVLEDVLKHPKSLTARYLRKELRVRVPPKRRESRRRGTSSASCRPPSTTSAASTSISRSGSSPR